MRCSRCRLGWQGPKCKQCAVLPGCVHGTCQGPLECRCEPGWTGLLCQTRRLSPSNLPLLSLSLSSSTPAITLSKLSLFSRIYLERFPIRAAICSQGCSREYGGCRRPGTCRCRVGWTGPNCTECVPYPGCVHGSCKRPWECRCEAGWAGDLCNEKLTYCDEHPGICRNNATCISMTKEDGNYR